MLLLSIVGIFQNNVLHNKIYYVRFVSFFERFLDYLHQFPNILLRISNNIHSFEGKTPRVVKPNLETDKKPKKKKGKK